VTRLGVDFGTSNTVAVLQAPGRPARPLLFDGSPQLPSAVFADPAGGLLTGRDAVHHARTHPERFAPHPKRDIDDGTLLLGDAEPRVAEVIGAVLKRVRDEAIRVAGAIPADVVLTHPAAWGPRRREVLAEAARQAGMPRPALVAEPVAAAAYFVAVLGARVATGGCVVVYDFGAGTFDASVVRRSQGGFQVLASVGLPDAGGLDVDAAVVSHLLTAHPDWDPGLRQRLTRPASAEDRRARMLLWEDARGAKEMLSRTASTFVHVPLLGVDMTMGREQLEELAGPIIERTVEATRAAISDAGVAAAEIDGVFLVGGSSRIPLAATMLHRALGIAPTVLDQPELVVAEGAVRVPAAQAGARGATGTALVAAAATGPGAVTGPGPDPGSGASPGSGRRRPRRRAALLAAAATVLIVAGAGVAYSAWPGPRPRGGPSSAGTPGGSPAASLSPSPAPSGALAFPAMITGTWAGRLTQSTDGKAISVEVKIDPATTVGTVSYPTLGCRGTLTLTSEGAAELKLREQITAGRGCTRQGTITLNRSTADRFLFTYVPDSADYSVGGVLTRK
jgi:actin-like ATPase involved in cell morphogenesis